MVNDMQDLTAYVNIKQGTNSDMRFSRGNTLPQVTMPFGMNAFSLQTTSREDAWHGIITPRTSTAKAFA